MNDEAGLSSLGLPTHRPGWSRRGIAAMAAASTLSLSATLCARVRSWQIYSSPGCPSPSEHFRFQQPTSISVLCPLEAWGRRGRGGPGGAVALLPYLAGSLKKLFISILAGCKSVLDLINQSQNLLDTTVLLISDSGSYTRY